MAATTDADDVSPPVAVVLHRHPAALIRSVGTTISLLHPASDGPPITIVGGAAVWDAFSSPCVADDAVARVVPVGATDADAGRRVVRAVIDTLVSAHLLTPGDPDRSDR